MGTMTCAGVTLEFNDRVLTHLQVVIMQRFRRGEAFAMSWVNDVANGSGRGSLWLTPTVPLYFRFDGSRVPAIDRDWLEQLMASAGSSRGLVVASADGTVLHPGRI